jgi:hypothetical protein
MVQGTREFKGYQILKQQSSKVAVIRNYSFRFMNRHDRPGTHRTGGWVGPRASLDGRGKSHPHRDSIPGPSSP